MTKAPASAQTFTAKTIELAKKQAAEQFGVPVEEIQHELISQTSAGILSFLGGKKVEIKAWSASKKSRNKPNNKRSQNTKPKKNNRKERAPRPQREAQEAREPREALDEETTAKVLADLKSFCSELCGYMTGGESVQVDVNLVEDRLTVNIDSETLAKDLSKNTRIAEALEHLMRKKPRYLKRDLPFRIFVDANGVRKEREVELVEMAKDLSSQVVENGKPVVLNYRSSYDRKIIHMALDKDDQVYTKSIGHGSNRKLMILPVENYDDAGHSTNA